MKIDLPGLLRERLPSGNHRYRVRVDGNKARRIALKTTPDHPDFIEHYRAARRGVSIQIETPPADRVVRGSIAWLTYKHIADLEIKVAAGNASPLTLKKRMLIMEHLRDKHGEMDLRMPQHKIIEMRDNLVATPAWADSVVEGIRSMYRWGVDMRLCDTNPAIGIGKIDRGKGGADPWTKDDLKKFRSCHPKGTTPHLALTLFMFTACRISDAVLLGRKHEFERAGTRGIAWQPTKRGSAKVEIPMLPPLYQATRAPQVQGETYLLNDRGQSFSTPDSLGQMFRRWCSAAGLKGKSSHGIRKAAGALLAEAGCSQYQIMSVHGHTQAKTSEIYTKGAERWALSQDAMKRLEGMEW